MNINNEYPIFIQVAEYIKDNILIYVYKEEEKIPSTTEFSVEYKINPATARKGFTILVDEGILYKQRGIGMFVSKGAREKIIKNRQKDFFEKKVKELVEEAEKIEVDKETLIKFIEEGEFNE